MMELPFREAWGFDFEYIAEPGERPVPVCLVAKESRTKRLVRLWQDEWPTTPPFPVDDGSLVVGFAMAGDLACWLGLGWKMPSRLLDLHTEFPAKLNGKGSPLGDGLLAALATHGIASITKDEKTAGRALVLRGGPWSTAERREILTYCETDVTPLAMLLERMLPGIRSRPKGLGRALLRGRYVASVAHMESTGTPLDVPLLGQLRTHWKAIKLGLVAAVDRDYGVYRGSSFSEARFADWLKREHVPWPLTDSGRLSLERDTFHEMARSFPKVAALGDLRHAMGKMRLEKLTVGRDGRNRVPLMPFRAKTGRNQPSNAKFIFGPGKWMRGLIRPNPGKVLAYIDWSAQEVAIAAALSDDPVMIADVLGGDPYLALAKMAGLAPEWATKESHEVARNQSKTCLLGINYGMGAKLLAQRIAVNNMHARHLLRAVTNRYRKHAQWAESAVSAGFMRGHIASVFGWPLRVNPHDRPTSILNFPVQAGGNEMLRIACCLATEAGLRICCPIHDAVLLEADEATAKEEIATCRGFMAQASRAVTGGIEIKTDLEVIRWPDRYMDKRGVVMWQRVMKLLGIAEQERGDRLVGSYVDTMNLREPSAAAEADSIAGEGLVKGGVLEAIRFACAREVVT